MEPNYKPISLNAPNLLHDLGFLLHLKFEVRYAASVRGGHAPIYLGHRRCLQLVSPTAVLAKKDLKDLAAAFPIINN